MLASYCNKVVSSLQCPRHRRLDVSHSTSPQRQLCTWGLISPVLGWVTEVILFLQKKPLRAEPENAQTVLSPLISEAWNWGQVNPKVAFHLNCLQVLSPIEFCYKEQGYSNIRIRKSYLQNSRFSESAASRICILTNKCLRDSVTNDSWRAVWETS